MHAEVDRGGQQGDEDSGDKMVVEGRPTGAGGILPRHLGAKLWMDGRLFCTTAYDWDRKIGVPLARILGF